MKIFNTLAIAKHPAKVSPTPSPLSMISKPNKGSQNKSTRVLAKGPTYVNADIQKSEILNDNEGKSGIYKWTRRRGGRSYIGSSIDIKGRLRNYFNYSYIETQAKLDNSLICKALLQYGYYAFSLEILEYCKPTDLKLTEQKYMDLLKPEYNTVKQAGNSGLKRTAESKERMRSAKLGTTLSEETKARISVNRDNSKAVRVTNDKTAEVTEFSSMRKAAANIGVSHTSVSTHIKKQGFYKGKGYTVYPLLF